MKELGVASGKGTWVPKEQRDTRWYIFKHTYLCRVPNIQTMSVEYIQQFGMPASGYAEHDAGTANELVTRMLSINDMVVHFGNGVNVAVVNWKDTKDIYEKITDHLNAWKEKLEIGWHTRDAPIDDLLLLDRFAMKVYQHAVHQFTTETVDSILARRMSSVLRVSRQNLMGAKPKIMTINGDGEKEGPAVPERTGFADTFLNKKAVASGAAKWR